MKRILMATAAIALSIASVAQAQEWQGRGGREGRGDRHQQQQQAQPQQQQPQAQRGGGEGRWQGRGEQRARQVQAQPQQQVDPQAGPQSAGGRYGGGNRGDGARWSNGGQDRQQYQADRNGRSGDNRQVDRRRDGARGDNNWQRRAGDDRRWSGNDRSRPDYRGGGRYGRPSVWQAPNRFRASSYRIPRGYSYSSWSFGQILPGAFFAQEYVLHDFWNYGLPEPPPGLFWVRSGNDALLVERGSGYIAEVVNDLFW